MKLVEIALFRQTLSESSIGVTNPQVSGSMIRNIFEFHNQNAPKSLY
jgi:hypothetical protein